jgi:transposase-like protein
METKNCAVYVIPGYDVDGVKDILGIWTGETEGKHYWMQIFDEIKARGEEDSLAISWTRAFSSLTALRRCRSALSRCCRSLSSLPLMV